MQRRQKDPLQIEADLFAAIATMDQLSKYFDKGLVEETLYRRQFARENIEEKYPEGMRRLDLAEGLDEESVSLEFKELKELPVKSADYVANAIELVDLLKLRTVAKIEYIVPLLDDMYNILSEFPNFGSSHWCVIEIDGWRKSLLAEKPSMVLPEEQCEKIEFDAVRWLNEFRRLLKEL
ncbi:MAG: hypothetical protein ACW98K_16970 [Candidatus Kariarchaeaceae archaeon]|jgi:hypothetical protein